MSMLKFVRVIASLIILHRNHLTEFYAEIDLEPLTKSPPTVLDCP